MKRDEDINMEDLGSNRKDKTSPSSSSSYATFHEPGDKDGQPEETFTISEVVEKIGLGKFQILLILMAGFINMCDSVELMLLSVLAPTIQCLWHLSSWEEAFITTVVFMGMASGSILWGWLADNVGRKVIVVICAGFVFYFGFLSSLSPSYIWIIALRSLVGLGIGGITFMYALLVEFLPIHVRSYVLLGLAFFWAFGSAFLVGTSLIVMPTLGWRWLLGIATVPVAIFVILCKWVPESPRFFLAAGEKEEALNVLHRMAKVNGREFPQGTLRLEKKPEGVKQGRFQDLFSEEYRMTTLFLWLTFFTSGTLYYGVVLMATEIFKENANGNGGCSKDALVLSSPECGCKLLTIRDYTNLLWTTFAEFPGLFLTMWGMERLGRKKTLAAEFFLIAATLALLFICSGRTLMLVFIFVVRGLSLGVFQGFFVYAPEVYPTIIRSLGFGSCCTMARVGAMLTPYVAQVLLKVSMNLSLGVYISLSLLAAMTTLLLPYETKGRALQDT